MDYPKRNIKSVRSLFRGAEVKTGTSKAGKFVCVVNSTAYAVSDAAKEILQSDNWMEGIDGLQSFEFQVNDTWIPVICKAGGALSGQRTLNTEGL